MKSNIGYSFSQLQTSLNFIDTITAEDLGLS
jgi:hypothetical protein